MRGLSEGGGRVAETSSGSVVFATAWQPLGSSDHPAEERGSTVGPRRRGGDRPAACGCPAPHRDGDHAGFNCWLVGLEYRVTLAEETAPLGPVLDGIAASSPAWRVLVDGWPRWRLWRAQWKRMRVPKERRAAWRRLYFARLHTWRAEAQRRVDAARCWDTGALSRRLLHIWNDATNHRGSPQLLPGYPRQRGDW